MSAHEEIIEALNLPFRVPCPPPALRMPPMAYRTPPPTLSSLSRSIHSPPLGARFPGDRIAWAPLVFPGPQFVAPMQEMLEEISGVNLDNASCLHSESGCLTLEIIECAPDIIHENEHTSVSVEDQPTASIPMGGDAQAESVVDIQDGYKDALQANNEVNGQAGDVIHEDEFEEKPPSEEPPFNQVEHLPGAELLWRELPLAGDSVVIKELAVLIGIPAYEVLRNLIGLGIFSKTTDSISAEVAKKIGCQYGVSFVNCDSLHAGEVAADCGSLVNVAALVGNITFRIANGQHVRAGDWIRDSILGLGRILELHTHPDESDRHRIWFVGQTEDGTVIEDYPLLPSTLGIIDKSMVPADILEVAPDIAR